MSVGAAAAIKAAIAVLSNEEVRKKVGWVIVAILSPLIVLVVLLCAILSGTSQHNVSAVELCFHGGSISASATPEYRGYIEEMRNSFARIDDVIAVINSQCEDGKSLDDTRVKAIFYALYFAAEQPGADGIRTFADCFVDYEERTRTVIITDEDGNVTEATETYTVATPVEDLAEIYERISQGMGIEVTTDHQSNADSIYSLILYAGTGLPLRRPHLVYHGRRGLPRYSGWHPRSRRSGFRAPVLADAPDAGHVPGQGCELVG